VNRDFSAAAPGEKMVGDITYIATWEGWLYLATVIDCHTKEVVGCVADDNYRTPLIEKAIEMAARNHPLADGAIFHSDRGSNYTSQKFASALCKYNLRHSVGRSGICYDNAMAESFFAALKNERVHRTPVSDPGACAPGHCEVHRILVQFKTSAFRAPVPDPEASPRGISGTAVRSVN
jgi:putative transposase